MHSLMLIVTVILHYYFLSEVEIFLHSQIPDIPHKDRKFYAQVGGALVSH